MGSAIERFLREQSTAAPAPAELPGPTPTTPTSPFADVTGASSTTAPAAPPAPADDLAPVRLKAAVRGAESLTPARAVRVLALQGETGLPADLIERRLDDVEREARRFDFDADRLQRESPLVAAWMAETPAHAAAARPDVARLSWLERQVRHIQYSFAEGRATVERSRLGEKAMAGTLTGRDRALLRALDDDAQYRQSALSALGLDGLEDVPGVVAGQLPIFGRSLEGGVANARVGLLQGAGIGAVGGGLLGSAAGGVGAIPGAATGAVAGAAVGAKTAFALGSAVEAARMEGALAYLDFEELRDERGLPLDHEAKRGAARVVGVLNGALELAGLESIVAATPGLRSLSRVGIKRALQVPSVRGALLRYARAVGTGTLTEGATEAMQSLVAHGAGELTRLAADGTLQGMSADAIVDAVFSDAALSAAWAEGKLGAKAGGGITTVTGGAGAAVDIRRARQAKQVAQTFQRIGAGVEATELRGTAPAALEQIVERMAAGTPVETVYLPVGTFSEYWQSKGIDPAQVAEEVLGQPGRAAFAEAQRTGSDLAVPMAQYATRLAPTEHNGFFVRELRTAPDAMNAREADEFLASEPVAAADADAAANDPTAASAARVRARMVEQLTAAGYEPQAADTYAAVYEAAFRTMGERASVDPEALFDRFGVSVQRAESPEAMDAGAAPLDMAAQGEADPATGEFFQTVSTRVPTAAKATEDALAEMLVVGLESSRADPKAFAKNTAIIANYPNVRPVENAEPDAVAEQFIAHAVENLLWLHDQIDAPTRERSKLWYVGARAIVDQWAPRFGVSDVQIAGVMAVLSPQKDWFQNVSLAERVLTVMTEQQDTAWTDEMTATASRIMAKEQYDVLRAEITGRTLRELEAHPEPDLAQAAWVRVYDETYTTRAYPLVTPEGGFGETVRTGSGSEQKVAWGSFNEIGKAISIFRDGSIQNVSESLGGQHKVRNFYNNIFDPFSPHGDVTIDTHAVAAALIRPLAGGSTEVLHNFGGTGAASSSVFGSKGTYGIYAEAYRRAAAERGILPREMQSITWEAVRGLFTATFKSSATNVEAVDAIWTRYRNGEIDAATAREQAAAVAGGINPPEWVGSDPGVSPADGPAADAGELAGGGVPRGGAGSVAGRALGLATSRADDLTLEQRRAGADAPRGRIRFRRQDGALTGAAIDVFAGADLSTVLHESAHLYLEVLGEIATGPDPAASISRDFSALLTWFGIERRDQITREHHETFARAFEAYLYEGRAPTAELRGAFARFRAWLVAIYRNIAALDVTLTPEVRGVFDRLLATDAELEAARQAVGAVPLFADPAAAGLTEEQAARYTRAVDAANRAATERLTRETMREYQRERAAWWKEARAAMRDLVAAEANADPALRARSLLARHVMPDGSEPPPDLAPVKLSKAALVERFGPEILSSLPRPYVYAREGGLGPDEAAFAFGFPNGEALVQALVESERPADWIERVTDERMRAEHGDLLTDGRLPEAALDAIHTDRRARLLRLELEYLATADLPALKGMVRSVARRVPPLAAVQAEAEATIAAKRVRDVSPITYQRAEQRAARMAVDALLRGDVAAAFEAKQQQLLAHALWRAATDARARVDGAVRFLGKYETPKARARLGKAGRQYLAQVDALLARYDLGRGVSLRALDRRQSLREFVAAEQAAGRAVNIPEALLAEAGQRNWQDATVEEVLGLRDAVAQIAHLARLKNRLLASDRARTLDEARAEIVGAIGATHDLTIEPAELNPALGARLAQGVRGFLGAHTRLEFFFRFLDGGVPTGVVWSYLFKPMADAEARESAMREADAAALRDLFAAYTPEERARLYRDRLNLPVLATGTVTGTLTKANLLAIALNQGNAYNRDALLAGYGWTQAQVDAVLDAGLDARDWAFVQGVWDYIGTYWPAIAEQQQRLTGLEPERVEATPVVTRHGTFAGGYYPIKFDGDLSHKQAALDEKASVEEMMGGNWARAMTRHGHTIARTDTGGKPLRLDLGVVGEHLAQVTHDLAFRLPVLDVHRLLQDEEIARAIEAAGGSAMRRQLNPWLVAIAGDRGATQVHGPEKALGHLRAGATVVGLGLRVTTSLLQLTGLLTTVSEIGARDTARGLRAALGRSPRDLARQYRFVAARSRMMVDRRQNFDRDVRDYLRREGGLPRPSWMPERLRLPATDAYFALIGWMDMVVAVPTWLGAYGKALDGRAEGLAAGDEPAAIAYADMVVRTTQGAGSAKDLAGVQRGGEAWRLFTMYYSSMSVFFNQLQQTRTDFARTKDVPRLLAQLTLLWFLPAVLDDLLKGDGPEDDENAAAWALRQIALFPPSTVIGVRDVASAVEWGMRTGQTGFDGSPAFGAGEELVRALLALQKMADPDEDVTRRDVKAMALTVGYFAKLPTSQAWTTAEYLADVLTGITTPTGPVDFFIRATTRGTPREDR